MFLPTISNTQLSKIQKLSPSENLFLGTSCGLKKKINEDFVGFIINNNEKKIRLLIADGHWGNEAAKIITRYWLNKKLIFPTSRLEAIKLVEKIEVKLFDEFGKQNMNSQKDFTPEASFIACELNSQNELKIISYGDCRAAIFNHGQKSWQIPTQATWLGAFSYLNLRNRLPVAEELFFQTLQLKKDDLILLYTDGIDECIYETPTLNLSLLMRGLAKQSPTKIFHAIMKAVFSYGAEDNASLIVMKI